jgi:hypothetical protein
MSEPQPTRYFRGWEPLSLFGLSLWLLFEWWSYRPGPGALAASYIWIIGVLAGLHFVSWLHEFDRERIWRRHAR